MRFYCGDLDYVPGSGGGTFENVDGSDVDITLSGMASDYCGGPSIVTGINNGLNEGVVHTYEYSFSEAVDVTFSISDINVDLELPCYYDFLVFSGDPTFTYLYNVSSDGDTIIPIVAAGLPAYAGFSYENIMSFTFTHGDGGTSCNPGLIRISNMKFTPIKPTSGVEELGLNNTFIVNSFVQNQLILRGDFEIIPELSIVDLLGRKINVTCSIGDDILIDTSLLPNGQYILYFEEKNEIKVERFVVSR